MTKFTMPHLAAIAPETEPSASTPELPLPLPEELRSYGLARSLHVIRPLIEQARRSVRQALLHLSSLHSALPFEVETTEQALAANLTLPLLRTISRVIVLELQVERLRGKLKGITSAERFSNFMEQIGEPGKAAQILNEYPILASQLRLQVNQWTDFSLEFIGHLASDWARIRPQFFAADPGTITKVKAGSGDLHKSGRSVLQIAFQDGSRLIYKPRSMAIDEHFQRLLLWFNDAGFTPSFRTLNCLHRGSYGWSEFIASEPCTTAVQVDRFYRRQGGNLALLYALEACDFHYENLIAAGEHPVLIDLEALFHPRPVMMPDKDADAAVERALVESILRTHLLPIPSGADAEEANPDLSGLGSPTGQLTSIQLPQWDGVNTDEMRLIRKRLQYPGAANRPLYNKVEMEAADHIEALAKGFADIYNIVLNRREEFASNLRQFEQDETRLIVRPTQDYSRFIQESLHPDLLRNSGERESFFDRLRPAPFQGSNPDRLLLSEREDMLQQDVPFFTTKPSSRDIWDSRGQQIQQFHAVSGMQAALARIADFSEHDRTRQLWILRASLHKEPTRPLKIPTNSARQELQPVHLSRQSLINNACCIGDRLEATAYRCRDEANWLRLFRTGEHRTQLGAHSFDLYDGLLGIAVFLAYLAMASNKERYYALAHCAWKTVMRQWKSAELPNVGGFTGLGGVVYALSHLFTLWQESDVLLHIEQTLAKLEPVIDTDSHYDITSGAAGCILGISPLLQTAFSARASEIAVRCGEKLLETAHHMPHGIGWWDARFNQTALSGFAHGNAGVALALLRLFQHTADERFASAAYDAIEYERTLFSPEHRNWRDLREASSQPFMVAWCHGAPGIALARMNTLPVADTPELRNEIAVGLATTLKKGFSGNHSLCHGDLGNADILLEADNLLSERMWREGAERIAAHVLNEVSASGWICGGAAGLESPGLMTGLSGIGYSLLRLADPSLPCLLAMS